MQHLYELFFQVCPVKFGLYTKTEIIPMWIISNGLEMKKFNALEKELLEVFLIHLDVKANGINKK